MSCLGSNIQKVRLGPLLLRGVDGRGSMEDKERYSAAWQQFLVAKRIMLAEYDQARTHSREQAFPAHHGVVGEAAVRDWLGTFLPKRYGIAPGFIRAQGLPKPHQTRHFDVIIYDQLEAPTLWIEVNKDKSDSGRARIIPVEYVRAILEVKSAFNKRTVNDAVAKLGELAPIAAGLDAPDERYQKYLPASTVLAMMFFELRADDRSDVEALNLLRSIDFCRGFYGAVILRGETLHPDDTAIVRRCQSAEPIAGIEPEGGLLHGMFMTESAVVKECHLSVMMTWADTNFSQFAFDLLALLNGAYRQGFASSFHGLEIRGGVDPA